MLEIKKTHQNNRKNVICALTLKCTHAVQMLGMWFSCSECDFPM